MSSEPLPLNCRSPLLSVILIIRPLCGAGEVLLEVLYHMRSVFLHSCQLGKQFLLLKLEPINSFKVNDMRVKYYDCFKLWSLKVVPFTVSRQ
jgi:hypothetical protein